MKHTVRLRAKAQDDVRRSSEYIRRDNPRAALRFVQAVYSTCSRLAEMPDSGGIYFHDDQEFPDLRCFNVSGFRNYLIFYRAAEGGIEVFRVLHGAQDLGRILTEETF